MLNKINQTPEERFEDEKEPGEAKLERPEEELGPKPGECWCSCNTCDIYEGHCHNEMTGCRVSKRIRS